MALHGRAGLPIALTAVLALAARGQERQGPPVAPPPADPAPVASPATTIAPLASRVRAGLEVRGMAVPMHDPDPTYDYGATLGELPPLGVTHVSIFVHLYQPTALSPAPARHPLRSVGDRALRRTIEQARRLGLRVALVPSVSLADRDWRGRISPPSWERWFRGYQRELLHWARLAEDAGASLLSVGSELSSTEGEERRWRALIADVRATFSGQVTYSANWDRYRQVAWWDALDYVGISAYYELTTDGQAPTPDVLRAAWLAQRRELTAWREAAGLRQPFLFLEVGYPSLQGSARKPWDYTRGEPPERAPVDVEEQRLCYEAFVEAWRGAPELAGLFFYEWWGEGGPRDGGYTPRGKPALDVVRAFFGGAPPP